MKDTNKNAFPIDVEGAASYCASPCSHVSVPTYMMDARPSGGESFRPDLSKRKSVGKESQCSSNCALLGQLIDQSGYLHGWSFDENHMLMKQIDELGMMLSQKMIIGGVETEKDEVDDTG